MDVSGVFSWIYVRFMWNTLHGSAILGIIVFKIIHTIYDYLFKKIFSK